MHTTPILSRRWKALPLIALAATAVTLGACNDFLKATNPGAIPAENLNDSIYINLMVNGVQGELQPAVNDAAFWSAKFSDEARNHHVFAEEVDFDVRQVTAQSGTAAIFYNGLQRARFMGDTVAARLKIIMPDSATNSLRIARVLASAGYVYTIMGEIYCGAAYNLGPTLPPDSSFARARARFTEARTIATVFRATITPPVPATAPADSIINIANAGIARAALGMGDWAAAEAAAALVTNTTFDWRAYYSANSTRENNRFFLNLSNGTANNALSVTPFFQVAPDPRVPYPAANEATQNGITARVPNSPSSWSTYTGTAVGAEWTNASNMRLSSYLEAQYIFYEARLRQGNTAGALVFLNSRRAVGGQTPAALVTAATLLTELRDQRRRDFYLDGHRLGDMRRYKRFDSIDFYESGLYPGTTTGVQYGAQVCFPIPAAELQGNPNATQPAQNP